MPTNLSSVIPAKAGIQVCKWNRLRRCLRAYGAARRAAAGYFLLLVQEKVAQEKDTPEPP